MHATFQRQIDVLYVDDNPDITELTKRQLEAKDDRFSVSAATSVEEGLQRLADSEIDCILSDYVMPEMTGIEFLETVSEQHPDLPFILYTGEGSEAVASEAISAGVTDYLQKKVGRDDYALLANRIVNAVNSQRREQALQESKTINEALTDPVYVLDDEGKFTYVNDEFVDMVGYDRARILGSGSPLIKDDETVEEAEDELGQLLSDDGPNTGTFEVTIEPRDGDPLICEDHMGVLPYDGDQFNGSVGILRDITDRKERKQELTETNERLDQFVSTVSHDLRNPLTIARSYLTHAESTGDQDDFDTARDALDRMDTMIEELLTVARSESIIEETEPIALADLATEAWQTAQTGEATFENRVDESVVVDGDSELLQSIFENLFRNATDHNDEPVTVSVGTLDGDADGFCVVDDGQGIPEDEQEEVFEHGFTNSREGTGYGLSIVEKFVTAHDWDISVTSGSEGGARFDIHAETSR